MHTPGTIYSKLFTVLLPKSSEQTITELRKFDNRSFYQEYEMSKLPAFMHLRQVIRFFIYEPRVILMGKKTINEFIILSASKRILQGHGIFETLVELSSMVNLS